MIKPKIITIEILTLIRHYTLKKKKKKKKKTLTSAKAPEGPPQVMT